LIGIEALDDGASACDEGSFEPRLLNSGDLRETPSPKVSQELFSRCPIDRNMTRGGQLFDSR